MRPVGQTKRNVAKPATVTFPLCRKQDARFGVEVGARGRRAACPACPQTTRKANGECEMADMQLLLFASELRTRAKEILVEQREVIATLPYAAHAQGTIRGAEEGAAAGDRAAGPVGAIVGGAVGAATGTVGGILGVEERPRFREYVIREHRPSFRFGGDVRVGEVLPERGVTFYERAQQS
jgi:hypothetical protein